MSRSSSKWLRLALSFLLAGLAFPAIAAVQLASQLGFFPLPPAGAGGDSGAAIISSDGRFVVFASTANNLVLNSNGVPIAATPLPTMNVYLRDRVTRTTALVSVSPDGISGGNADSIPLGVSTNGQFVLFESAASNFVAGDTNNANDVFVRDLAGGTTFLVSVNTNGVAGSGASYSSAMTPDGRYVAFTSAASDLVAADTNGIPDVFVRDLVAGTTTLVSTGAMPTNSSSVFNSISDAAVITPDGRYVAFYSTATNLVTGVQTSGEIYLRDLTGGTTLWASTTARTLFQILMGTTNVLSFNPVLSDDGRFLAFEVSSNTLVGGTTRGLVLRYNRLSGLTDIIDVNANVPYQSFENIHTLTLTLDGRFTVFIGNDNGTSGTTTAIYRWDSYSYNSTLVSGDLNDEVPTNSVCDSPSISADGRYVVFVSDATNLTANPLQGDFHIYRRDVDAGTTVLVDADPNGLGTGVSPAQVPALSADGALVAFVAADGNLVSNDSNHRDDVFVRDVNAQTNQLISLHDPGLPCLSPNDDTAATSPSVSLDGRFVAFASEDGNLTDHDTNGLNDVFVRDLFTGSNILVSVDTNGVNSADGLSTEPSISGDGRYVAFTSLADNLVPGDTNRALDVYVRDLQTGLTTPVSVSADGTTLGNADSYSPTISADGQFVLFHSRATNLANGITNSGYAYENLYYRDLLLATNYVLTKTTSSTTPPIAAMTPNARFVVFAGQSPTYSNVLFVSSGVYLWDRQVLTNIYATRATTTLPGVVAISSDGRWIAYQNPGLTLVYLPTFTSSALASAGTLNPLRGNLRFNADGRLLVYSFQTNGVASACQVYLYNTGTGSNLLVSQSFNSTGGGNDSSDSPDISADGRFIVFRSLATNLVAGVISGMPQLFVYDQNTGATSLLTTDPTGTVPGDNRSLAPMFSGDGRMIFFRSWAENLSAGDFNQRGDAFGYAFLYLSISAAVSPGSGPTISWPVAPGQTYQVQYKDDLSDATWQNLSGTITIMGNRGYLTDPAPSPYQRFYRVVAN